jgi:hypothetical protein
MKFHTFKNETGQTLRFISTMPGALGSADIVAEPGEQISFIEQDKDVTTIIEIVPPEGD